MKRIALPLVALVLSFIILPVPGLLQTCVSIESWGTVREYTIIRVPDDYSTIQEAINVAQEGDTVLVTDQGTYNEELNFEKNSIILDLNWATLTCPTGTTIEMRGSYNMIANGIIKTAGYYGIHTRMGGKNTYENLHIADTANYAIYLRESDSNIVKNVTINKWGKTKHGIRVKNSDNNWFEDVRVLNVTTDKGIYVDSGSSNNTFTNIQVYNVGEYGIQFDGASNNTIKHSVVHDVSALYGIYVSYASNYNKIINCTVYNSYDDGIKIVESHYTQVIDCTVYDNAQNGSDENIAIRESNHTWIENCTVYGAPYSGIIIEGSFPYSENTTIKDCHVYGNGGGIYVDTAIELATPTLINNNVHDNIDYYDYGTDCCNITVANTTFHSTTTIRFITGDAGWNVTCNDNWIVWSDHNLSMIAYVDNSNLTVDSLSANWYVKLETTDYKVFPSTETQSCTWHPSNKTLRMASNGKLGEQRMVQVYYPNMNSDVKIEFSNGTIKSAQDYWDSDTKLITIGYIFEIEKMIISVYSQK